jgi:putative membrane protein
MDNLYANFSIYALVAIAMSIAAFFIFELVHRPSLFKLVTQNNTSAAIVLGGRVIGLGIILAFAITNSVGILDLLIWSGVGVLAQIISFYLFEWLTPNFNVKEAIIENKVATATLTASFSITIGLIVGACLTY